MATVTLTNGPDDYTDPLGQSNRIEGLDGDDIIHARDGDDVLIGGAGADMMFGELGDDLYVVDDAGDVVVEGRREGTDLVRSSVDFALPAEVENLTLTGSGDTRGLGNNLSNHIIGNDGDNVLSTGRGGFDDVLEGGLGDDVYVIRNSSFRRDSLIDDGGIDTVRTDFDLSLPNGFENLVLTGHETENGNGNALDNRIIGNAFDNFLSGNDGNDVVKGGGGDDILHGGSGSDRLVGGSGADTFEYFRTSDSNIDSDNRDVINDFQDDVDQFDFTVLEAVSGQNLHFIGSADFSGDAGELHTVALRSNPLVEADIDGDGAADFQILLRGAHTLSADDFVL